MEERGEGPYLYSLIFTLCSLLSYLYSLILNIQSFGRRGRQAAAGEVVVDGRLRIEDGRMAFVQL